MQKPKENTDDTKPSTATQWNRFDHATPHSVVAGFVLDADGQFPMLHRSAAVRSAPNCWSVPSGLHDIGETMEECFIREMQEELNITVIPGSVVQVGAYENIPGDGWHWVIQMVIGRTETLDTLVNTEPDKHDEIYIANLVEADSAEYFSRYKKVHDSAIPWYESNMKRVIAAWEASK